MIHIAHELERINTDFPQHSKTSCDDTTLANADHNGVCFRCNALSHLDRVVFLDTLRVLSTDQMTPDQVKGFVTRTLNYRNEVEGE